MSELEQTSGTIRACVRMQEAIMDVPQTSSAERCLVAAVAPVEMAETDIGKLPNPLSAIRRRALFMSAPGRCWLTGGQDDGGL